METMPASPTTEWPLRDPVRGQRNLDALRTHLGADRFVALLVPLGKWLPMTADPDLALNNLERLFAQPAARQQLSILLDPRGRGLESLLQLLATSQFFADTLVAYPEAFEVVYSAPKPTPSTTELVHQLKADVDAMYDDSGVLRAFRRFRHLQMLRIGVNDVLRDRPLEEVTRELSRVADASVEVAMQTALRSTSKKYGQPMIAVGQPAKFVAFAFGKLGGDELNYSSDIDLMFLYDQDGETTGKQAGTIPNADYFARVVSEVVRLLSNHTDRGIAYRVDLRLRPDGARGPLARSMASTLSYYDVQGRTWERQALIKLRPIAGDMSLGREFHRAIEPFIYRKYFSFSEINEVKALKRRMEQRTTQAGADELDVKTGRGGIRDIEYTVQFLQLLNGGDLPAVRQRNTLLGLESLEIAGCLTGHEMYILADAYRFLRKTEHRLQLLFDWQTHKLPTTVDELSKLARRMGYLHKTVAEVGAEVRTPKPEVGHAPQKRSPLDESGAAPLDARVLLIEPLDQFLKDYHDKTKLDRAILNHLLHQTFTDADQQAEPETDLILVQDPDDTTVRSVLGRYPFRNIPKAYQNLAKLAQEEVPFLSHRRCRHFLASIAPQLLRALAATPDPDLALNNFERVTASLGGKAVLYELISFNPPSLKLYVDICSTSPYLSAILINNPGMIDELLDTLILDQPRTAEELHTELVELCRGANDPDPILHSFQDKELLRIGVRDLLGKDSVQQTTAALSDLADTLLTVVFDLAERELAVKRGVSCRYVILGLGKLGGREISFHSDLDLVLLYETDGMTTGTVPTTYHQYFTQLAQRAIRVLSQQGPLGRLYNIDMRLRPTGKNASLVVPLAEFHRYFDTIGGCQLWERQALTRARVIRGESQFADDVTSVVRKAILAKPWCPDWIDDIRTMRDRMEPTTSIRHTKRGPGGLVDIEFLVQMFQLKYGREHPAILQPNLWVALEALQTTNLLDPESIAQLRDGYSFLRLVEARLRVVTDRATNELPEASADREKLAHRMGFEAKNEQTAADRFTEELARIMANNRRLFRAVLHRERNPAV